MEVLAVQNVDHLGRPREQLVVEEKLVPVVAPIPVIPVLNDSVDRDAAGPILPRYLEQFLTVFVMFLALPVAIGPFPIQRRAPVSSRYPAIAPSMLPPLMK